MNTLTLATNFADDLILNKLPFAKNLEFCGERAILALLEQRHELSAGDISNFLSVSTARIAVLLKNLEKKDLIKRLTSQNDKRKTIVHLTKKGEESCKNLSQIIIEKINNFFLFLGEEDTNNFIRLTQKMREYRKEKHND